jgi:hypothetical protein
VNSLWVPSSAEEALNIAKQKSPDIKTTAAGLGVEEKMLEGLKARLGPQVYLNYSYGLSRYWPDFQSRGGTWAVVLTIPFGASSAHAIRAQKLSVEAAKLEKESAIEDIFQRLKHSYLTLERGLKNSELSSAQFRESEKNLTSLVGELTDGPLEKNLVTRVKAMVESDSNTFGFLLGLQADIFWSKFEIQQAMGLLFEQVKGNQ